MITKVTREKLVKSLERIGWTVDSKMNGYAFKMANHRGVPSPILINSEKVFVKYEEIDLCFYLNKCNYEFIGKDTISFFAKENPSVFINFYGERKK